LPEVNSVYIECYVYVPSKKRRKFLVIKRSETDNLYPGIWQIVTGRIEKGEKAYETALREVSEETGLEPKRLFVLPHTTSFYSPKSDSISLVPLFVCEVGSKDVKLSAEHSKYAWLDSKKASQKLFFKSQKENVNFIDKGFNRKEYFKTVVEIKF
jgi:dihydroneopterin triphosphate diphosphatase